MTENFSGFSDEMCRFFIELRFNNNKEWFGANRDRYTKLVKEPMDAFAAELNEALIKQTGVKTMFSVSRINRDIRFTKNKEPYRDHRWVVFKRDVGDWKRKPVLYFEIGAEYYSVGLGFYDAPPEYMSAFRKKIDSNIPQFESLIKKYDKSQYQLWGDSYKKKFPGQRSDSVNNWYTRKSIALQLTLPTDSRILSREILDFSLEQFMFLMPLNEYLNGVSV